MASRLYGNAKRDNHLAPHLLLTMDSCCELRHVFTIHHNPLDINVVIPFQCEEYRPDFVRRTLEQEWCDVRFVRISHAEFSIR